MSSLRERLVSLCGKTNNWLEVRYHNRRVRALGVRKGEVNELSSKHYGGVGLRVLVAGSWGFSSTSDVSPNGLEKALRAAEEMATELQLRKRKKVKLPATARLATQDYLLDGYHELLNMPMEEKFQLVMESEEKVRGSSQKVEAAACRYNEIFEEKIIVTSDGANTEIKLVRPELRFVAFGADGTNRTVGYDSVGGTGGWECLFRNRPLEEMIETASSNAIHLLKAPAAAGGKKKVILSPSMVGMLSHEAIGHTVEADFVNAGSIAQGKIGELVASPLVSLLDSGASEHVAGAGGSLPADDEGVLTQNTKIITAGKLVSYLHSRETAAEHGVEPTGNSRAWEFSDEPLIRMRNTYVEPGTSDLGEMIGKIDDGYYVDGPEGGQADATAEFMFGANKVRRIVNGKLGEFVQNVTVAGNAFEVLKSVDAVSKDFVWDLGSGYCGKGQPAKVDAGGPYLSCELLVGGKQK